MVSRFQLMEVSFARLAPPYGMACITASKAPMTLNILLRDDGDVTTATSLYPADRDVEL
jgi:hypothetical protein